MADLLTFFSLLHKHGDYARLVRSERHPRDPCTRVTLPVLHVNIHPTHPTRDASPTSFGLLGQLKI